MSKIIYGTVIAPARELPTKYGQRLLVKVKDSETGEELNIWGKTSDDTLRSKRQHEQVSVYEKPSGGYALIEHKAYHENGLKHISQPLSKVVDEELDGLLTRQEKERLKALIIQNSRILNFCIKTVKEEIEDIKDAKDLKSLAVTIFISSMRSIE